MIAGTRNLSDDRQPDADALLSSVKDALLRDELAQALEPVLSDAERRAVRLLAPPSSTLKPGPARRRTLAQAVPRSVVVAEGARSGLSGEAVQRALKEIEEASKPGSASFDHLDSRGGAGMIAGAVTDLLLRAKVEAVCKAAGARDRIKVSGPWHGSSGW